MLPILTPPGAQIAYDAYSATIGARDKNGRVAVPSANLGRANLRKSTLTRQRGGLLTTATLASGVFKSFLQQHALAGHYTHVRIGVLNASTSSSGQGSCPQVRCSLAISDVSGDPTVALNAPTVGGFASAWLSQAVNGNTAPQLRQVPGSGLNNPSIMWFDWYPLESQLRAEAGRTHPILNVMVEYGGYQSLLATAATITLSSFAANANGWEQDTDLTTFPYGRIFRTRSADTACCVAPSGMTSTTNTDVTSAAIIVQYALRDAHGIQYISFGDSTNEGTGDTTDKAGWINRMLMPQSTLALPVELFACAQAGSSTAGMASMAKAMMPESPNSIVIFPMGSPNSTMPLTNFVSQASIVSGGTGGTNGAVTLTGTTGTGTPFQIAATISGGTVTALGAITAQGNYTQLPTLLTAEPVTGGGLTGCTLSLKTDGAVLQIIRRDISTIKSVAEANGCAVLPNTWPPADTAGKDYKGSDPIRQGENANQRNSGRPYLDTAAVLEGLTVGSQIQYAAGLGNADHLHASAVGHTAQATEATKFSTLLTGI